MEELGFGVIDVQFGGHSPDAKYENMRAYMWGRMRDWLLKGAIENSRSEVGRRLETDLTGPNYAHTKRDKLILESKETMKQRGLDSPDDGDALALTFAMPVVTPSLEPRRVERYSRPWG